MEIDELPENDERLLKKPEIKRDDHGRFDRHGKTIAKNSKNQLKGKKGFQPGQSGNPAGRPKGVANKVTVALKEAILAAGERARRPCCGQRFQRRSSGNTIRKNYRNARRPEVHRGRDAEAIAGA
jgi:Family of unknown function (DUF5681)